MWGPEATATSGIQQVVATQTDTVSWVNSAGGTYVSRIGWATQNVAEGHIIFGFGTTGLTYGFVADTDRTLIVDFLVQGLGTNLFGLQGYVVRLFGPQGGPLLSDAFTNAPVNSSGELTASLLAGNFYTLFISQGANIGGGLGTRDALMVGTFDFSLGRLRPPNPSRFSFSARR